MKVKVISYNRADDYHIVRDVESDEEMRIDLMVSGDLGNTDPVSLIGKVVEYERTHPWISSAHGVKVLHD